MKNVLLCTAMTMAFINFANADYEDVCPNKDKFKEIVKEHKSDVEGNKDFTFTADSIDGTIKGATWKASSMQFPGKKVKPNLSFDDIINLDLNYNTSPKSPGWCHAQFHDDGLNMLTIHVNKQ